MAINVVHAPTAQAMAGTANAAGLAMYGRQRQQELEQIGQQDKQLAEQSRQFDVGQENTQKRALMGAELDIYQAQLGEYGAQYRQQQDLTSRQTLTQMQLQASAAETAMRIQAQAAESANDRMFRAQSMQYEAGNQAFQADQQRRYNAEALQFEAQKRAELQRFAGAQNLSEIEFRAKQDMLLSKDRYAQQTMTGEYAGMFGELAQRQFQQKQQEVNNAKLTLENLANSGQIDAFQYRQALQQVQAQEAGLKAFAPTESQAEEEFQRSIVTRSVPIVDPITGRIKTDANGVQLEQQLSYRVANGIVEPIFHESERIQAQMDLRQMEMESHRQQAIVKAQEEYHNASRKIVLDAAMKGDPFGGAMAAVMFDVSQGRLTQQQAAANIQKIRELQAKYAPPGSANAPSGVTGIPSQPDSPRRTAYES